MLKPPNLKQKLDNILKSYDCEAATTTFPLYVEAL